MTTPGYQDRQEAFGEGVNGGPVVGSPSLDAQQDQANASVPARFTPSSSLHQLVLSPDGMSAQDAGRRLMGSTAQLPTENGMSHGTATAKRMFLPVSAGI